MVDIRYMTFFGALCTLMFSNIGFGIPDKLPEVKQPEPKVDIIQEEPKVKKLNTSKSSKLAHLRRENLPIGK